MLPAASQQDLHSPVKKYGLASCVIFVVFLIYYHWASDVLPRFTGPDYKSNNEATEFIFDHSRLAVLPDDEELVYFTAYGGTRSLRPPLSYLVSALVASIYPTETGHDRHFAFRKGSSLLSAAAVAICFYGLFVLFGSAWVALFGAALFGLLPQFTFIAAYNNDDSGAIFSATLLFTVAAVIYRRGASALTMALFGLAVGLAILAKFSAWLVVPFAVGFVAWVALTSMTPAQWWRYALLVIAMALIGGGWWILFNSYHYGLDDPVAFRIQQVMVDKHSRLKEGQGYGFAAIGIGFRELWIENYKNFIGETIKSSIGNLDWLRLRVGTLQYLLYKIILATALAYYLVRLVTCLVTSIWLQDWSRFDRRFWFESSLFWCIVFQFFMYTWTNIHNDIQIQGKYLLPVMMPILLLFLFAVHTIGCWIREHVFEHGFWELSLTTAMLSRLALMAAVLMVILIHLDALLNHVIPFYRPPAYNVQLNSFRSLPPSDLVSASVHNLEVIKRKDGIELKPTGEDPWVVWSDDLCKHFKPNTLLQFTLEATQRSQFQVFVDEGGGFREDQSVRTTYEPGLQSTMFLVAVDNCKRIRFDPTNKGGGCHFAGYRCFTDPHPTTTVGTWPSEGVSPGAAPVLSGAGYAHRSRHAAPCPQ